MCVDEALEIDRRTCLAFGTGQVPNPVGWQLVQPGSKLTQAWTEAAASHLP